jgi:hypothetical protein
VIGLIVVSLLLVGAVAIVLYLRSQPPTLHVVWQAPTASNLFSPQEEQAIDAALAAPQTSTSTTSTAPTNLEIDIISAQREGDWATFSAQAHAGQDFTSDEPGFFIAHYDGSTWTVYVPGSALFCEQLQHIPNTLLAPIDKSYFC